MRTIILCNESCKDKSSISTCPLHTIFSAGANPPPHQGSKWATSVHFSSKKDEWETPQWLMESPQERKNTPVYSGVIRYFPDALCAVARLSLKGNQQHNPDKPLHWDRSKSGDELDALARHLLQCGTVDTDGVLHDTKVAWRALANLQKVLESKRTYK